MDKTFIQSRVTHFQNMITDYESAILAFENPTIKQYKLNTGQTQTTVERADLVHIQNFLERLYAQYQYWYNLLNGGNTIIQRPAW